ncbi:MAG: hypothetical protein AAF628_08685 [Planctomycetota bacterium]
MITTWFWVSFAVTGAGAAVATTAGWRRQRRLHLWTGPSTLLVLFVTVLLAERLAGEREFPDYAMRIHLPCAKTAGLLAIGVALTGVVLWRSGRGRVAHRVCVLLFLLGVVVATATGCWAFFLSVPAPH